MKLPVFICSILLLCGCAPRYSDDYQKTPLKGNTGNLMKLFTDDHGCNVMRFFDRGDEVYYVVCPKFGVMTNWKKYNSARKVSETKVVSTAHF